METIAMIPARYAATRFPGKLMQLLGNKPVILHTYDATVATGLFDKVTGEIYKKKFDLPQPPKYQDVFGHSII